MRSQEHTPVVEGSGFGQPVPRSLVHKELDENVFITDVKRRDADHFICYGVAPQEHPFFNENGRNPKSDLIFFTEFGRQASIAVSHCFLNVLQDDVFIMRGSKCCLPEGSWWTETESDVIAIEIHITERQVRRGNRLTRAKAECLFFNSGINVCRGTGEWTVQSDRVYRRMRRAADSTPVPCDFRTSVSPQALGREVFRNVVISDPQRIGERNFATDLLVDYSHHFFFDHLRDHVPGILLLEACAQVATIAVSRTFNCHASDFLLYGSRVEFLRFAELNRSTRLEARIQDAGEHAHGKRRAVVVVGVAQSDESLGEATLNTVFQRRLGQ